MQRDTSKTIYQEIRDNGLLAKRRMEVYDIIYKYGSMTGAEVSNMHKIKFGTIGSTVSETIRNRITELRDMGVVRELGTTKCPITNNTVILWDVTSNLPKKLKKRLSKKEKKELILADIEVFYKKITDKEIRKEIRAIKKQVKNI
jgi:hypothetical protein